MRNTIEPRGVIADGGPVVLVELSNRPGKHAKLDREDWQAWIEAGRSTNFFANGNGGGAEYVFHYDPDRPGENTLVARTLASPGPQMVTRYANGDRFDLRRANLWVTPGKTGSRLRANP